MGFLTVLPVATLAKGSFHAENVAAGQSSSCEIVILLLLPNLSLRAVVLEGIVVMGIGVVTGLAPKPSGIASVKAAVTQSCLFWWR